MDSLVLVGGIIVPVTVFGFFGILIRRRFRLRKLHPGWIECGLRVASGEERGLARHWRNGIGWMENGVFVWTRIPIPSKYVRLKLVPTSAAPRQPKLKEAWGMNPDAVVELAKSETAEIEIGVLEHDLQHLRKLLRSTAEHRDTPAAEFIPSYHPIRDLLITLGLFVGLLFAGAAQDKFTSSDPVSWPEAVLVGGLPWALGIAVISAFLGYRRRKKALERDRDDR